MLKVGGFFAVLRADSTLILIAYCADVSPRSFLIDRRLCNDDYIILFLYKEGFHTRIISYNTININNHYIKYLPN